MHVGQSLEIWIQFKNKQTKNKPQTHLHLSLLAKGSCFATSTPSHAPAPPVAASLLPSDTTPTNTRCPTVLLGVGQCLCPCSLKPGRMFLFFYLFFPSLYFVSKQMLKETWSLKGSRSAIAGCLATLLELNLGWQLFQFVPAVLEVTASCQDSTLSAIECNTVDHPARVLWAVSTLRCCLVLPYWLRVLKVSGFSSTTPKEFFFS